MRNENPRPSHCKNIQHHSAWVSKRLVHQLSNAPLKNGDVNNPSNYNTIMIIPLFVKLFGSMVEHIINKRAEKEEKRAKGQESFRLKHSTIDHRITLIHIIEKV